MEVFEISQSMPKGQFFVVPYMSGLMTQNTAKACNPQLHRDSFSRLKKPAL